MFKRLFAVACAAALCGSCVEEPKTFSCTDDEDCDADEICNAMLGICQKDVEEVAKNEARADFSCEIKEEVKDKADSAGALVTDIDGEKFAGGPVVDCYFSGYSSGEPQYIDINFNGLGRHKSPYARLEVSGILITYVSVPIDKIEDGATVDIGEDFLNEFAVVKEKAYGHAMFTRMDCPCLDMETIAGTKGGRVTFDEGSKRLGGTLKGTLNIRWQPYAEIATLGTECHYTADCGVRTDLMVFCQKGFDAGDGGPGICSPFCESDADCAVYDPNGYSFCSPTVGICAPKCESSSQCPGTMYCVTDVNDENGCFPESYLEPASTAVHSAPIMVLKSGQTRRDSPRLPAAVSSDARPPCISRLPQVRLPDVPLARPTPR